MRTSSCIELTPITYATNIQVSNAHIGISIEFVAKSIISRIVIPPKVALSQTLYPKIGGIPNKKEPIPAQIVVLFLSQPKRSQSEETIASIIEMEEVSLPDKIDYVANTVRKKKKCSFKQLLEKSKSKVEVIVSFLAVLELIKIGEIEVHQEKTFGDIYIDSIV